MSKYVVLICGIVAAINVIDSFYWNPATESIFMFEVNIWVFRSFWAVLAAGLFWDYSKRTKKS